MAGEPLSTPEHLSPTCQQAPLNVRGSYTPAGFDLKSVTNQQATNHWHDILKVVTMTDLYNYL
jgi:hypothetical protein